MNKYKKYSIIAIVGIIFLIASISVFSGKKSEQLSNEGSFEEVQVTRGSIKVTASGTGNIQPSVSKSIKALENGIIDKIVVEEGQLVKEGDLILTFESETEDVGIERAKLSLEIEENKYQELINELNNLKIIANTSGYVQEINGKVGDELSKGFKLTTIVDKTKLNISGYFHKGHIDKIKVGDKANVQISEFLQTIPGTVVQIKKDPIASGTGAITYEVIVEIDNPGGIATTNEGLVKVTTEEGTFYSTTEDNFQLLETEEVILKTSGELVKLYVNSGDYVEKGDVIAELINSDLESQIENAKINLESSKLELSEKLEDADNLAVYAPIDGIITNINVTEGERVSSNYEMATISDLQNLQIIIPIDELDINKVEVGQKATVIANAIPDKVFNAEVSKIALVGDIQNGVTTYDVTLSLLEIDDLKPGMSANGEIIIDSKQDILVLPIEAIQQTRQRKFVLVKDEGEEHKMVPVEIGLVSEEYVEIIDGLKEEDTVVYPVIKNTSVDEEERRMNFPLGGVGGGPQPPERRRQQ